VVLPGPTELEDPVGADALWGEVSSSGKTIPTEPVASDFYGPLFMGAMRPV
jgi:hypothetical protein